MFRFLPRLPELPDPASGVTQYVLAMLVLGVGVGLVLRHRWRHRYEQASWVMIVVLLSLTLLLHAASIWILFVDPLRNSGNIPLPGPAVFLTEVCFVLLLAPGLFAQGFALPAVIGWTRHRWFRTMLGWLAIAYSVIAIPWFVTVIYD